MKNIISFNRALISWTILATLIIIKLYTKIMPNTWPNLILIGALGLLQIALLIEYWRKRFSNK